MATLTRTRILSDDADVEAQHDIRLGIPTPFPTTVKAEQDDVLEPVATEEPFLDEVPTEVGEVVVEGVGTSSRQAEDLLPSIGQVQSICLATLNDLLSTSTQWTPILPDRRHSTPAGPLASGSSSAPATSYRSSALQTLVSNLRLQDSEGQMVQTANTLSDTELLHELRSRITTMSATLPPRDAELARTLVSVLSNFHRLSYISPLRAPTLSSVGRVASWNAGTDSSMAAMALNDPYSTLRRQVSDFQLERSWSQNQTPTTEGTANLQPAQSGLLWSLIDDDLENVLSLCRYQDEPVDPFADTNLPPQYDPQDYEHEVDVDSLPEYEPGAIGLDLHRKTSYKAGSLLENTNSRLLDATSEKMRMDLEAVTLAIDRLYLVAPQLHNQRVELKKSKVEEMERAKRKGKQKHQDSEMALRDLDRMVELIGKASNRKMADQAVSLDSRAMQERLARARQKDQEKRAAFVDVLAQHSDAGRLHSQDAVFTPGKRSRSHSQLSSQLMDPHAMLTLPEFIREGVPEIVQRRMDIERESETLLTLPEFIREHPPPDVIRPGHPGRGQSVSYSAKHEDSPVSPTVTRLKGTRSRSMSEPLAWLLPKSSSPSNSGSASRKLSRKSLRTVSPGQTSPIPEMTASLDVSYVAEYHENLQHILVFMTVSGLQAGQNLEASVVPPEHGDDGRARLLLRCGTSISQPLELPAQVGVGPVQVSVVGGQHFQVKLAVPNNPSSPQPDIVEPEFDAAHFQSILPTTFICSSCSLPLVRATQLDRYRDLPSEHWAELVDAWMCHADQTLHEHVQKNSRDGFWPGSGEALVGGSYILVREDAIVKDNLCDITPKDVTQDFDEWSRVRCICGAVIGRCQPHASQDGGLSLVYRLAKFAFRPVSPTAEPSRIPLSAFIIGDMTEYIHAHATYRFVIMDEEEEKPRILVWLFKPAMRIAYSTPRQFVIPKSGSIRAAKVLFKVLGPFAAASELQTILTKYPGFPQAEHLSYPFEICRRLAALLKESSSAYPESLRTMTGLDVGWLQRS